MEKAKREKIIKILLVLTAACSALLRLYYIYYTPSWRRQHDVIGFGAEEGQAAFIEFFHQGHLLIDFDPRLRWGFFQPPLHHMIAAAWVRLLEFFGVAYNAACEHVQVLTFVYSLITLFFAYLIFKHMGLYGESLLISFAIAAVHPGFILMSGSVNNDMLAIMFTVMAVYYGMKWYDTPSWTYTVILALTIGAGMMTKLSAALAAPAIAFIFAVKCIQGGIKTFVQYMTKFVVFGFVCGPIALWSPIRNYILFGVPINYTPEVGEEINASVLARIFDIRCTIPYVSRIRNGDPYDEFNMFLGMMKTSLFGDENFAYAMAEAGHSGTGAMLMTIFGWLLLISGSVLAAVCFYCTVRVLISGKYIPSPVTRLYIAVLYSVSVFMYISFMFKAPYYSSMDFRYVLYLIPVQALTAGLYIRESGAVERRTFILLTGMFVFVTFVLYTMLGRVR